MKEGGGGGMGGRRRRLREFKFRTFTGRFSSDIVAVKGLRWLCCCRQTGLNGASSEDER